LKIWRSLDGVKVKKKLSNERTQEVYPGRERLEIGSKIVYHEKVE